MQDIIARSLGAKLNGDVEQINKKIEGLSKIFTFKGTKERVEDLPKEGNKPGDMWSVKGREYVWTLNDETGEYEWVDIGDIVDLDAFIMKTDIEQTIGDNENKVMSQKAIKDTFELYYNAEEVDELIETLDEKKADLDYVNSKGHYLGLWNAINGTCDTGLEVGTEYVPGDEFVIGEASAPKNMIVNGDFSVSSTAVPALFGWNVTAWNALRSKRIEGGVAYVQNGTDDNKTIKQTVNNLIIGETYWLTAKLLYVKDKAIKILLDDNGAKPIVNVPISDEVQTFSVGIVATSTSHTITFSGPNANYALTDVVLKSQVVPNYRPFGDTYTGAQKVEMESVNVEVNDSYLYDGTNWRLLKNVNEKIDVDADLNPDSTNPVQNRVVTAAIQEIKEEIGDLPIDLNGAERDIYIDPASGQDSRDGLTQSSSIRTWGRAVEIMNLYNNTMRFNIKAIGCGNDWDNWSKALDIGNTTVENKIIYFTNGGYYEPKSGDFIAINSVILIGGSDSTLCRSNDNANQIIFDGQCSLYMTYQSNIVDDCSFTSAASAFMQSNNGKLSVYANYAPSEYFRSKSEYLFGCSYSEGNLEFYLGSGVNLNLTYGGNIGYLAEANQYCNTTLHLSSKVLSSNFSMTDWTDSMSETIILKPGLVDLKGKELQVYIDSTNGNDYNTGLSTSSKIKTWSKLIDILNGYKNGTVIIDITGILNMNISNKNVQLDNINLEFVGNVKISSNTYFTNETIAFYRGELTGTGNGHLYFKNVNARFGDYKGSYDINDPYESGQPFIMIDDSDITLGHYNYSTEITSSNDNGLFASSDDTTINTIKLQHTYGTISYLVSGGYGSSKYGAATIYVIKDSMTKISYITPDDSYGIIIYNGSHKPGSVDLKGESLQVYIDSTNGNDNNTGLSSNSKIKTWSRLLEILNGYKNGKVKINITGTLDMNITNKNVQLDNVDLEFVGNVTVSMNTYFTNVNITYHDGDWVSSAITYLTNCSFTAYTCTLDDDNLASNQPRFTVIGSRVYLGHDTSWCTLASTNKYGLFYCNGTSSEFYLQRADGTVNYLCDYSGSSSIKYSSVIYVYGDDITKTGYINEGDSKGVIIYKGTHTPLPQVTSADNGKVLTVEDGAWKAVAPKSETYELVTSDWHEDSTIAPFTCYTIANPDYNIGNNTTVELINNNPLLFANYGFAIKEITSDGDIKFVCIKKPTETVTLTVMFEG